ncbi:MAG: T9SS type A sorting domain-containing protein [bacterium]
MSITTKLSSVFFVVTCLVASNSFGQWSWSKVVGVSGSTDWGAVTMDDQGNFLFAGTSDKLAGSPSHGFVMAKYSDTLKALWNTKLLGGSAVSGGLTSVGVDAGGNSYMIDKSDYALTAPDATKLTYFLPFYFISKFLPNGSMAWSKILVMGEYKRFQVMPDGTICIYATGLGNSSVLGSDSIKVYGNVFLEINTDGTLSRAVSADQLGLTPLYWQWQEKGKVFVIDFTGPTYGPWYYHKTTVDLSTKAVVHSDSLKVTGKPNTFAWNTGGVDANLLTTVEPTSGHIYAIMGATTSDIVLNDKDTLHKMVNTQTGDGYVVELDETMKVVHMIHVTNPVQLVVRGAQVVLTAIVRGTADFGFVSPDTTIRITRKSYLQDGTVVYVMDRSLHYQRHGLVEAEYQKPCVPNLTFIAPSGDIYLSLNTSGTLFFQGMAVAPGGSGTVLAKLGGPTNAVHNNSLIGATYSVFPNPASSTLSVQIDGDCTISNYEILDVLGKVQERGIVSGNHFSIDVRDLSEGTYFLRITDKSIGDSRIQKFTILR